MPCSDQDPEAIVQRHIKLLHTYNEIKDGAQALIAQASIPSFYWPSSRIAYGQYARLVQKPLKQVYEESNLPCGED